MIGVYTKDTLKVLNKTQLTDLFVKIQDQTDSTIDSLIAEKKDLNCSFKKLESDVQTIKIVNNNLLKLPEKTERQCWANVQYLCHECVVVIVFPKTVESKDSEHIACKVFKSIGFDIEQDRIEVCHWPTKSDHAIIKFSQRKDCQHLMRIKKGLKDLHPTNLSFPEGTKIYVNVSLCLYYWGLLDECKKLWNNKKIYSYFTVNDTIRIIHLSIKKYHTCKDLSALFPEEQIFMS